MNRLAIFAFAALGVAAAQSEPIEVVTTTAMIADVAQNVAGECATVTPLMGPGTDPHSYRASADDTRSLGRADAVLYSGYALEGELGDILEQLAQSRPTVAVAELAVPETEVIATDDAYGVDPHVWMDVSLWARVAEVTARALSELAPDCADTMTANAQEYSAQLTALDSWVRQSVASIPEQQRILVTAHDAFNYYARAYELDVAGIQGISTAAEAAIGDIRATVDVVVERQVPAIFVESSVNPRTIDAVRQAAANQGVETQIGGQLYSDAMGQPGTADGTYIGMIVSNTRTLTQALGGTVPPFPENLRAWAQRWDAAS